MPPAAATSDAITPRRIRVLLPLPLAGAFDYSLAEDLDAAPGDFVVVPLANRQAIGVVWDDAPAAAGEAVEDSRLKAVAARLDVPGIGVG